MPTLFWHSFKIASLGVNRHLSFWFCHTPLGNQLGEKTIRFIRVQIKLFRELPQQKRVASKIAILYKTNSSDLNGSNTIFEKETDRYDVISAARAVSDFEEAKHLSLNGLQSFLTKKTTHFNLRNTFDFQYFEDPGLKKYGSESLV